ncbi:hypothetical protein [Halocatena pleomorpha]|nr:hypothetical protein [Halocatena pleomorpha]
MDTERLTVETWNDTLYLHTKITDCFADGGIGVSVGVQWSHNRTRVAPRH